VKTGPEQRPQAGLSALFSFTSSSIPLIRRMETRRTRSPFALRWTAEPASDHVLLHAVERAPHVGANVLAAARREQLIGGHGWLNTEARKAFSGPVPTGI
jgi:hypothetical protein